MSDDETPPSSGLRRRWYLVGAIAVVAVTIVAAITITVIATRDGDAQLDTATAAEHLARILDAAPISGVSAADLASCPVGPAEQVLGNLAEALGGGPLQQIVDQGEIGIRAIVVGGGADRFVDCTAEDQEGETSSLGLVATAAPQALLDQLQAVVEDESGEPLDELGVSRGGQYVGRCQRNDSDCGVFWYDDELLVGIGGSGPAFADIDTDQVQAVLAAVLPALVDRLAES